MQKDNNQEQSVVPSHVKCVHHLLSHISYANVKEKKRQLKFAKEALITLLHHDAFESTKFRESFTALICHLEIEHHILNQFSKDEINLGVAWAINKIESEVKNA